MPCTRRATAIRRRGEKAEIVSLRGAVIGVMRKPPFEQIATGGAEPPAAAFRGKRPVYFAEPAGFVETPTYRPAARSRPATASRARR